LAGIQNTESEKSETVDNDPVCDFTAEDVVRVKMRDCGLFYIKETEENWIIFCSRTFNSVAHVSDPSEKGVFLHWHADGPSSSELLEMQHFTGVDVREFADFVKSDGQIFIPCPPGRSLNMDISKVKRQWFPNAHPRWLVTIIPFHTELDDSHAVGVLPPYQFPDDFVENFDFSRLT